MEFSSPEREAVPKQEQKEEVDASMNDAEKQSPDILDSFQQQSRRISRLYRRFDQLALRVKNLAYRLALKSTKAAAKYNRYVSGKKQELSTLNARRSDSVAEWLEQHIAQFRDEVQKIEAYVGESRYDRATRLRMSPRDFYEATYNTGDPEKQQFYRDFYAEYKPIIDLRNSVPAGSARYRLLDAQATRILGKWQEIYSSRSVGFEAKRGREKTKVTIGSVQQILGPELRNIITQEVTRVVLQYANAKTDQERTALVQKFHTLRQKYDRTYAEGAKRIEEGLSGRTQKEVRDALNAFKQKYNFSAEVRDVIGDTNPVFGKTLRSFKETLRERKKQTIVYQNTINGLLTAESTLDT